MWKMKISLLDEAGDGKDLGGGPANPPPAPEPLSGPSTEQSVDNEGLSVLPSYLIADDDEDEAPASAPAPAATKPPEQAPAAPTAESPKAPEAAKKEPSEPKKPVEAPKAEAKKEEPKAAAPAAPAPTQAQEPVQPPAPAPTGDPVAERQKRREAFHSELSSAYGGLFTEEDRDKLVTEPAEVLPKLAAELHIRVMESVMHGVFNGLPAMMQQQIEFHQTARRYEDEFFSEYKELDSKEGRETVARTMAVFRHFNPNASIDVVKRESAAAAMQALGLSRMPQQQQQPLMDLPPVVPVAAASAPTVAAPAQANKSQEELFYEEVASEGRFV